MRILVAMQVKLKRNLKPSLRQSTLNNMYHALYCLYVYFTIIEGDNNLECSLDVARLMYGIQQDQQSDQEESFEQFLKDMQAEVKKEFPALKKVKKPRVRTAAELQEEALTVK